MTRIATTLFAPVFAACGALAACLAPSSGGDVGSETHFLVGCSDDADCGADLSCTCGLCTHACIASDACAPSGACAARNGVAVAGWCGDATPDSDLCLAACTGDGDCGDGQVCAGGACTNAAALLECDAIVRDGAPSHLGCDFFAVDLANANVPGGDGYFDAANGTFGLMVVNPVEARRAVTVAIDQKATTDLGSGAGSALAGMPVLADVDGVPFDATPLAPGESRIFRMPARNVDGAVQAPLSYHIVTSGAVTVAQMNPLPEGQASFSSDGTLLLPTHALGREHYALTHDANYRNLPGFVAIVATAPGTRVRVDCVAASATPLGPCNAGDSVEASLDAYDVLALESVGSGVDLSGTHVLADAPVLVFAGAEAAMVPDTSRCVDIDAGSGFGVCAVARSVACKVEETCIAHVLQTCCGEHLEEAMPPLATWGSRYVVAKTAARGAERDVYRILAADDDTRVTLDPPQAGVALPPLARGQWIEFESSGDFEIASENDKSILVAQYLAGADATGLDTGDRTGDPSLMVVPPIAQHRRAFDLVAPPGYAHVFVQVIAPTGSAIAVDTVDVASVAASIGGGAFMVVRVPVAAGPHHVALGQPGTVSVYGFDVYSAFAFDAGAGLARMRDEAELTAPRP